MIKSQNREVKTIKSQNREVKMNNSQNREVRIIDSKNGEVEKSLDFDPNEAILHILNVAQDDRPFAEVKIGRYRIQGLLDSGASVTVMPRNEFFGSLELELKPTAIRIKVADGGYLNVHGYVLLPINFRKKLVVIPTIIVERCAQALILGYNFWKAAGLQIVDEEAIPICSLQTPTVQYVNTEIELQKRDEVELLSVVNNFLISTENFIGRTHLIEHSIELIDGAKEFVIRPHLFSPSLEEKIHGELDRMLKKDVIEPSKSPVSSPIVPVIKPTGAVRLCLDSRKLNEFTIKDKFPIPVMGHIFARMRKANYLSVIDLKEAFWQIPLSAERKPRQFASSRELTAFSVPGRGLFHFKVMPFGLCNSPATQCRLMYKVLGHDMEPWVFVYMDDVLVLGRTVAEMLHLLNQVATRLTAARLSINFEKSRFFAREVKYLGYILSKDGVKVDPTKVEAMVRYPSPRNLKELRRFLGLTGYYRRLIRDYASIAAPLTNMLKKSCGNFKWGHEAEEAFNHLKTALSSTPVVVNPDFDMEFHLQCDASDIAASSVLGQFHESKEVIIAYYSHKWSPEEKNWAATEKEAACVLRSIQHFRGYIYGRPFTVITDAKALTHIRSIKTDGSSRLSRWALELNQYDLKIKHRAGKQSEVPDALSRAVDALGAEGHPEEEDPWLLLMKRKMEAHPTKYTDFRFEEGRLWKFEKSYDDIGGQTHRWKEYIPGEARAVVINTTHEELCHLGADRCVARIRQNYFWPGMTSLVQSTLKSCETCKHVKARNYSIHVPMGKSRDAKFPFQLVAMDHWGPVTKSRRGNTYLLVVVDVFSKYVLLHPCRSGKANEVIGFLEQEVFLKFGVPERLLSDNARAFMGRQLFALLNKYSVDHWTIPFYHSQGNPAERYIRTVSTMVRAQLFRNGDQRYWDEEIHLIQSALNSTVHTATQHTPFFLNFGREMILSGREYSRIVGTQTRQDLSSDELHRRFQTLQQEVSRNLARAHETYRKNYDRGTKQVQFENGERVWRRNRVLSNAEASISQKLCPKFIPGKIVQKIGKDVYQVQDEGGSTLIKIHANDLFKDN